MRTIKWEDLPINSRTPAKSHTISPLSYVSQQFLSLFSRCFSAFGVLLYSRDWQTYQVPQCRFYSVLYSPVSFSIFLAVYARTSFIHVPSVYYDWGFRLDNRRRTGGEKKVSSFICVCNWGAGVQVVTTLLFPFFAPRLNASLYSLTSPFFSLTLFFLFLLKGQELGPFFLLSLSLSRSSRLLVLLKLCDWVKVGGRWYRYFLFLSQSFVM